MEYRQHYYKWNNPLLHLQTACQVLFLEEVRVLNPRPQQPPRHSVTTKEETLLRRVNNIGKSLALSKIVKACKSIESSVFRSWCVYMPDCKILDEVYNCSFIFLSIDRFKRVALIQDFYSFMHSLRSPSIVFRTLEKYKQQDSERYLCSFYMDISVTLDNRA